jgi:hypothetical protein
MAETAKTPLAKPNTNTVGRSGHAPPITLAAAMPVRAAAEPTQPAMVQRRIQARFLSPNREPRTPTRIMPRRTPPCCRLESWVDWPGVILKTRPAKGSRINSCAL